MQGPLILSHFRIWWIEGMPSRPRHWLQNEAFFISATISFAGGNFRRRARRGANLLPLSKKILGPPDDPVFTLGNFRPSPRRSTSARRSDALIKCHLEGARARRYRATTPPFPDNCRLWQTTVIINGEAPLCPRPTDYCRGPSRWFNPLGVTLAPRRSHFVGVSGGAVDTHGVFEVTMAPPERE